MKIKKILSTAKVTDAQLLALKPIEEAKTEKSEPAPLTKDQVLDVVNALVKKEYRPKGWHKWASKHNIPIEDVFKIVKYAKELFSPTSADNESEVKTAKAKAKK